MRPRSKFTTLNASIVPQVVQGDGTITVPINTTRNEPTPIETIGGDELQVRVQALEWELATKSQLWASEKAVLVGEQEKADQEVLVLRAKMMEANTTVEKLREENVLTASARDRAYRDRDDLTSEWKKMKESLTHRDSRMEGLKTLCEETSKERMLELAKLKYDYARVVDENQEVVKERDRLRVERMEKDGLVRTAESLGRSLGEQIRSLRGMLKMEVELGKQTEMTLREDIGRLKEAKGQVEDERDALLREKKESAERMDAIARERDVFVKEKDGVIQEKTGVANERDTLVVEKDALVGEKEKLVKEKDDLIAESKDLEMHLERQQLEADEERSRHAENRRRMEETRVESVMNTDRLKANLKRLEEKMTAHAREREDLLKQTNILQTQVQVEKQAKGELRRENELLMEDIQRWRVKSSTLTQEMTDSVKRYRPTNSQIEGEAAIKRRKLTDGNVDPIFSSDLTTTSLDISTLR